MPQTNLSRRLTTLDAGFLYSERPNQPMHVGSCMIYEGEVSRDELIQILRDRLHLVPRYRQRLAFPPFAAHHPTWEDDPDFDIRNHVAEETLPAPGDDQVLSEVGGRVYSTLLERNRPLWQLVILRGYHNGNTPVIWKVHHAMVDGVSGVDLTLAVHDLKREPQPPEPPPAEWQPRPLPDPLSLLQDAVQDRLTEMAGYWTDDLFRPLRPREAAARTQEIISGLTSSMPEMLRPAAPTPFNAPVSAARAFAWTELPFAEVRAIKTALGGTVNDVVLAIDSGALGRYLRRRGFRTEGVVLRAMCPVSMRRAEERGALGNLVSIMIAPLHVGIEDPVARLQAEREAMERLKEQDQAGGLYALSEMGNRIPAALQMWGGMTAPTDVPNPLNTVSTNVPGPQIPLYLNGHPLVQWIPLGICSAGMGLFIAILTYNQALTFGLTCDPNLVPDVWDLADDFRDSFEELRAAAKRAAPEVASAASAARRAAEAVAASATGNGATNGKTGGTANGRRSRGGRRASTAAR
jgi:WS/DGAT/MGAT family acyltransferase